MLDPIESALSLGTGYEFSDCSIKNIVLTLVARFITSLGVETSEIIQCRGAGVIKF